MKNIRNYRANKLYGFSDKSCMCVAPLQDVPNKNKEEDSVLEMIYAPVPSTRLPDPRLPFKLMRSNSEAVKSVINDFVLKQHSHQSSNADADTALDFTSKREDQFGNERLAYQNALIDAVRLGQVSNDEGTE